MDRSLMRPLLLCSAVIVLPVAGCGVLSPSNNTVSIATFTVSPQVAAIGQTVAFEAVIAGNPEAVSRVTFAFGEAGLADVVRQRIDPGGGSTRFTASATYRTAGDHVATVTIRDLDGDEVQKSLTVLIRE